VEEKEHCLAKEEAEVEFPLTVHMFSAVLFFGSAARVDHTHLSIL
jgi:predicted nucleotidyltransferase